MNIINSNTFHENYKCSLSEIFRTSEASGSSSSPLSSEHSLMSVSIDISVSCSASGPSDEIKNIFKTYKIILLRGLGPFF
jgi:hypothetical protein